MWCIILGGSIPRVIPINRIIPFLSVASNNVSILLSYEKIGSLFFPMVQNQKNKSEREVIRYRRNMCFNSIWLSMPSRNSLLNILWWTGHPDLVTNHLCVCVCVCVLISNLMTQTGRWSVYAASNLAIYILRSFIDIWLNFISLKTTRILIKSRLFFLW